MKDKYKLIISIAIPLLVGIISSLISNITNEFNTFNQPVFTPPKIVFPIVWTILYILMGISSYKIYNSNASNKKEILTIYIIQLIINGIWSIIFFKFKAFFLAFILILIMIALVTIMIKEFTKIDKISGYLQIPYLIWLVFAGILNAAVYLIN